MMGFENWPKASESILGGSLKRRNVRKRIVFKTCVKNKNDYMSELESFQF